MEELEFSVEKHMWLDFWMLRDKIATSREKASFLDLLQRIAQKLEAKSTPEKTFPFFEESFERQGLNRIRHNRISCAFLNGVVAPWSECIEYFHFKSIDIVLSDGLDKYPFLFELRHTLTPSFDYPAELGRLEFTFKHGIKLFFLALNRAVTFQGSKS